jgi:hypothetical protein
MLHYSSDRTGGRKVAYVIDIQLRGATIPVSVVRIDLEISVAGQHYYKTFSYSTQRYTFTWDGKDGYGRAVSGRVLATIRIGYVYGGFYMEPWQRSGASDEAFGHYTYFGAMATGVVARREVTLWQEFLVPVGTLDFLSLGLGGWSITPHHVYDPYAKILYFGDGTRRDAKANVTSTIIRTVAGGSFVSSGYGDGGQATQANLANPFHVAVAPDGNIYIAGRDVHKIRCVSADGVINTVAGNGNTGFSGDGGPAVSASFDLPIAVDVAYDGSLYIVDEANRRIRRVASDGIITTFAGNGNTGFSGDGGPATQAAITAYDVSVAPDGSVYIADFVNKRIRRVGPDGIINTVAGNGNSGFSGDGGPATQSSMSPSGIDVSPDGSLYIVDRDNNRIRRIGPPFSFVVRIFFVNT